MRGSTGMFHPAVQHAPDLVRAVPRLLQRERHAGEEGLRRIGRHARRLRPPGAPARRILQHDIGEGAADIDGNSKLRGIR